MRITDHRYERDNRKHDLAVWMVAFMARTGTLIQWTRLTQYRLQKLFREYLKKDQGTRRRGISPIQPAYFFRSQRLESESLVLAYFAYQLHALPDSVLPNARRSLPSVARGERVIASRAAARRRFAKHHKAKEARGGHWRRFKSGCTDQTSATVVAIVSNGTPCSPINLHQGAFAAQTAPSPRSAGPLHLFHDPSPLN